MKKLLSWLQNYNRRHESQFNGMVMIRLCDDGGVSLVYGNEVIANFDFNDENVVKEYLLNE
jgi:hypothetical protein